MKSVRLRAGMVRSFDCVVIATDHSGVDYAGLLKEARLVFDSRNVFKGAHKERVERL
jgi:UDP-N-acetyl-D-glucosamine dehydrogenase